MKYQYPVNYIGITQGYHQGFSIDFGWNSKFGGKNQPIYAVESGVVYKTQVQQGGGNVIYIKHDDGCVSEYAHLEVMYVKKGEKIDRGQKIALMGNTGTKSTGNHLHFSLYKSTTIKNSNKYPCLEWLYVQEDQIVSEITKKEYKLLYEGDRPKEETKYVYNCDSLNVRRGAGTQYALVNDLYCGTEVKVKVYEICGTWARIGDNQWVSNNFLTEKKPSKVYKTKVVYDCDSLNVRTSNRFWGSNFATTKTPLPKGTIVSVVKESGNGTQIGDKRWVYSKYLK